MPFHSPPPFRFALAVCSCLAASHAARAQSLPDGEYNVLLILVDDLKPELNAFGANKMVTPNFDAFAETSLSFTRAYCQQAVCGPSRASLMTGLRPDTSGIWSNPSGGVSTRDLIGDDYITLPQHFGNNGYATRGMGKLYHGAREASQDPELSWTDGWSAHEAPYTYYEGDASGGKWLSEDSGDSSTSATDQGSFNYRVSPATPITDLDYGDGDLAAKAIAALADYASAYTADDQRFFLAVGFHKPHLPFAAPKSYWDLYDPTDIDLGDYDGEANLPAGGQEFTAPPQTELTNYSDIEGVPDADEARHLIHGYMASVSFVDAQVGKLLAELDRHPDVAANTIVVIAGDHGWHLADHGAFWTKNSNFEEANRTPLLIRAPGLHHGGTQCEKTVELVDLYPTLIDLANLPDPDQPDDLALEGSSLRPLLEDPELPSWNQPAFSQFQKRINGPGLTTGWGMGYSMRTERYRYTEWYLTDETNRNQKQSDTPEFIELYDHAADPNETVSLASETEYAAVIAALSAQLDGGEGWKQTGFSLPAADSNLAFASVTPSRQQLRISGEAGESWTLQSSSNLRDWTDLATPATHEIPESGSSLVTLEPNSQTLVFYRAIKEETVDNDLPVPFNLFSSSLTMYQDGDYMVIESDGVPNHGSPYFPTDDPRYEAYDGPNASYRQNPNEIASQTLVFRIPLNPVEANDKSDTSLGPIGIAINGVALFNQYAGPNQPLTNEIDSFDQYNGHPTGGDLYHYHVEPLYLTSQVGKEGLIGVLLDGFPVYGPMEDGQIVPESELDIYHGHFHATPEFPDGVYHYHFSEDAPYLNGGQYYGTPGTRSN